MSKMHSLSNQVYENVLLLSQKHSGLVTLKNKLLEKSLNLANNPVEDTWVLLFLLQLHATGPQNCITERTERTSIWIADSEASFYPFYL